MDDTKTHLMFKGTDGGIHIMPAAHTLITVDDGGQMRAILLVGKTAYGCGVDRASKIRTLTLEEVAFEMHALA